MTLTDRERRAYHERGYHAAVTAFDAAEAERYRSLFERYWAANETLLASQLPRERREAMTETHLFLPWVYELVSHPRVLDAVEAVLGPDILVWNSHWFPKFPHDPAYVSWHQDAAYWGLHPANVTTAWIALTDSAPDNGCLRVLPGSHANTLPQRETYARDNMLSRGQEITVEVDEAEVVDLCLEPGQFSLHHVGIAHGSGPNDSGRPRIGIAVRYVSPDVYEDGDEKDLVVLVRGTDRYGHFEIVEPPKVDAAFGASPLHAEASARKTRRLIPDAAGSREGEP